MLTAIQFTRKIVWSAIALSIMLTAIPSFAVLKVNGRFLYDKCGEKVILRGVEHMAYYHDQGGANIPEIAKTGANCVRLLLDATISGADLDMLIKKGVDNKMFVSIAVWHPDDNFAFWGRADIQTAIKKYEDYVLLHIYGEAEYSNDDTRWLREAKSAIMVARNAGYKAPVEILSTTYGRNPFTLVDHGQEVFDSDPEKNIIFGCQMYWGDWYTKNDYMMTITQGCDKFAALPFPVQVGACPSDCGNACWREAWEESYKHELGCLWWAWRGDGPNSLTNETPPYGTYGQWTVFGQEICGTGTYSMSNTAKRTYFQTNGKCNATGISTQSTPSRRIHDTGREGFVSFDCRGRFVTNSTIGQLQKTTPAIRIIRVKGGSKIHRAMSN